jgi:hypothetical protein
MLSTRLSTLNLIARIAKPIQDRSKFFSPFSPRWRLRDLLLTPSPRFGRHLSPTLLSPTIGPKSPPLWATLRLFRETSGLLGLTVSQFLVGLASIRVPPTKSLYQINTALSMPPPPKRGTTCLFRTSCTALFTQASSLVDLQNAVSDHLTDCGMDTIA